MTNAIATAWTGLQLDPLDTLFFRDGKPFEASNRVVSGLPSPQTLAGAIRTALLASTGFKLSTFRSRPGATIALQLIEAGASPGIVNGGFRGPFLALSHDNGKVEPLLPQPATFLKSRSGEKSSWSVARPAHADSQPGWIDPDGLLPLRRRVRPDAKAKRGYLTLAGLKAFLSGDAPRDEHCFRAEELFGLDYRIGIEIDPSKLTSVEGQIYSVGLLALNHALNLPGSLSKSGTRSAVCLYAEFLPGDADLDVAACLNGSPVSLGGEGHAVRLSVTSDPADWPVADPDAEASMWYLASPTFLPTSEASRRALPTVKGLAAASSDGGVAVSGWDNIHRGPRATRFAVPAGAVYFVDGPGGADDFLDHDLDDCQNLRREGWGFALQGNWNGEFT